MITAIDVEKAINPTTDKPITLAIRRDITKPRPSPNNLKSVPNNEFYATSFESIKLILLFMTAIIFNYTPYKALRITLF
jgi:hypothetical protein